MSLCSTVVDLVVKAMVEWAIFFVQFPSDRTNCFHLRDTYHESLKFRGYFVKLFSSKVLVGGFLLINTR